MNSEKDSVNRFYDRIFMHLKDESYLKEVEDILKMSTFERVAYIKSHFLESEKSSMSIFHLMDLSHKSMAQNAIEFTRDYYKATLIRNRDSVIIVDKIIRQYASIFTDKGIVCNDIMAYNYIANGARLFGTEVSKLTPEQVRTIFYKDIAQKYGSFVGEVMIEKYNGVWMGAEYIGETTEHGWVVTKIGSEIMIFDPITRAYSIIQGAPNLRLQDFLDYKI